MEITANAVQTVQPASNILFTETPVSGCCNIRHREGSGLVTLRGQTSSQCRARYRVSFGGNIAIAEGGTVGPISVALAIDGEAIGPTTMIVTPAAVGEYFNVFGAIFIDVPKGCCMTVSVRNISTTPIDVQNANLIAERVA